MTNLTNTTDRPICRRCDKPIPDGEAAFDPNPIDPLVQSIMHPECARLSRLQTLNSLEVESLDLARQVKEIFEGSRDPQEQSLYLQACKVIQAAKWLK